MMLRNAILLALSFSLAAVAQPQARDLHWRSISVDARLDSEGRLHVAERQQMVFNGDWNGGERIFNLRMKQSLDFERLTRIDDSGEEHPLSRGDLSVVDHYDWGDSHTIRWRSRLPSDPPFERTEISYLLQYTLNNVLIPRGDHYLLDHDFLFPDREGVIEKYAIRLSVDPPWQAGLSIPESISGGPLPPGRGHVLIVPLTYAAPGRPRAVWFGAGAWQRYGLGALLALAVASLYALFYRREKSLGRFDPLTPAHEIDESWLQSNVFSLLPEVVGAAWDESTGAPEVAAVLARMVAEGKLESEIRRKRSFLFARDVLHLKLCVDRSELKGYERDLIKALFFSGDTTDTDSVRKHYGSKGFDPASKIREPLKERIRSLGGEGRKAPQPTWKTAVVLALIGLALLGASVWLQFDEIFFVGAVFLCGINACIWAMVFAARSRDAVANVRRSTASFSAILFFIVVPILFFLFSGALRVSAWALAGATLLCIAMVRGALEMAKSRQGADRIRFRKKLAAARQWFGDELAKPAPGLRDEWYPYLLAFGLGSDVDRWFKAYGGSEGYSGMGQGIGSSSSHGSSAGRWSGGGGAFGGAGASASWAAAAGAMAAGVSSSSSGSGGGGGGGSSGGGGGGGW